MAPDCLQKLGSDVALPDNAVGIVDANGTTVQFEVTNLFPDDFNNSLISLIAIQYHDGIGSSECDKNFDPENDATVNYTAVCYDGYTDVSVYVYFNGTDFDPEECEACQAPEDDDVAVVAFYFELSCDNPCEPVAPAPTDCVAQFTPELNGTIGMEMPFPEDAVKITALTGDTVEFTVNQTWVVGGNLTMMSVHYRDSVATDDCATSQKVAYGQSVTYSAICWGQYASVGIYLYTGDDFNNAELCEQCQPPEQDDENMVAFYFELPCEIICDATSNITETETPQTTDCYDPNLDIVDMIGASTNMPSGTFDIQSVSDGTVTVDISQRWSEEGPMSVAVSYYGSTGSNEVDFRSNVGHAVTKSYTAQCFKGYAEFNIYAYANAPESECEGEDVDVYQVEVPCTPCECEPEAELLSQVGSSLSLPASVFDITAQSEDTVEFSISQNWESLSMFAVQYYATDVAPSCDVMETDLNSKAAFTAECFKGFAEVNLYVYADNAPDECEACSAPGLNSSEMVIYSFELPCSACDLSTDAQINQANVDDCYSGAELATTEGSCPSSVDMPIEILDRDGETVTFALNQTFSTSVQQSVAVRYSRSPYSNEDPESGECTKFFGVSSGLIANDFTALCTDGVAEVFIYTGSDSDTASCEYNEGENCGYHFVIPCTDLCPSSGQRGLDKLEFRESEFSKSPRLDPPANEPSVNDEDTPYCVREDFPCEDGEGSAMVSVCHYSARKGYETFCIPETDSDILRFYPNDYCGPCEGGYGGLWD